MQHSLHISLVEVLRCIWCALVCDLVTALVNVSNDYMQKGVSGLNEQYRELSK